MLVLNYIALFGIVITLSFLYQKYLEKDFVDVAYFEPYYLKDFLFAK